MIFMHVLILFVFGNSTIWPCDNFFDIQVRIENKNKKTELCLHLKLKSNGIEPPFKTVILLRFYNEGMENGRKQWPLLWGKSVEFNKFTTIMISRLKFVEHRGHITPLP